MDIYNFEIYILDFDGVIVDSEKHHYYSYIRAIENLNLSYDLTYEEYCRIKHSTNLSFNELFSDNYEEIYQLKKKIYNECVANGDVPLINGVEEFYRKLVAKGKPIYIVTDSTREIMRGFLKRYEFLNEIDQNNIISYDTVKTKKPNCGSYLWALKQIYAKYFDESPELCGDNLEKLKALNDKVIVFEDSWKGCMAATKIFYNLVTVNDPNYMYFHEIYNGNNIMDFAAIDDFQFSNMHEGNHYAGFCEKLCITIKEYEFPKKSSK